MADAHLIGTNLPFEQYEVAHIVAFVILSGLSILASGFLVFCIVRSSFQSMTNEYKIILSLCLSDLLLSLLLFCHNILALSTMRVAFTAFQCQFFSTCLFLVACFSFLSVFALAAHRYLVIFYQLYISGWAMNLALIGTWVSIILIFASFSIFNADVDISRLRLYCLLNLTTDHLLVRIPLLNLLGVGLIGIAVTTYVYARLCYAYFTRKRRRDNEESHRNEARLLFKSLTITILFAISYLPMQYKMWFELLTQTYPSEAFDYISSYCFTLNPLYNFVILYTLDYSFRRDIPTIFSINIRHILF